MSDQQTETALPQGVQEWAKEIAVRETNVYAAKYRRSHQFSILDVYEIATNVALRLRALEQGRAHAPAPDFTVDDVNAINALLDVFARGREWPERKRIADLMWKLSFLGQWIERLPAPPSTGAATGEPQ